jgi:glyoxylase-like metal-dependent hydrolase (beta-lactamase superfamily II)
VEAAEPWEVFDQQLPLLGAHYARGKVRMVALGLRGGGFVVVSPGATRQTDVFEALERRGQPRFLLAPNHFHNGGLALWKGRYPDAKLVADPKAHARLGRKVQGVGGAGAFGDLEALKAELPEGVRLFGPPMATQGEVWLSMPTAAGRAWYVCDAVVNDAKVPLLFRVLGFRPELMTNPLFKRLFLQSKAEYKAWMLAELEKDKPTLFIPSHGGVLRGETVTAELRRVTEAA